MDTQSIELIRTSQSWDGAELPDYLQGRPETKEIYLAGGCFWGTEHYFKQIEGVVETEV